MRELGLTTARRRPRAITPILVLATAAAAATGCAASAGAIDVREAQGVHVLVAEAPAGAARPQAALEGTLLVDAATGCLAVSAGEEVTGLVLPNGAELTTHGLVLGPGAAPLALDEAVELGGGYRSADELPEGASTEPCAYDAYFSANPPD